MQNEKFKADISAVHKVADYTSVRNGLFWHGFEIGLKVVHSMPIPIMERMRSSSGIRRLGFLAAIRGHKPEELSEFTAPEETAPEEKTPEETASEEKTPEETTIES